MIIHTKPPIYWNTRKMSREYTAKLRKGDLTLRDVVNEYQEDYPDWCWLLTYGLEDWQLDGNLKEAA